MQRFRDAPRPERLLPRPPGPRPPVRRPDVHGGHERPASIADRSARRARRSSRTSRSTRPPRRPRRPVTGRVSAAGRRSSPDLAAWRGTSSDGVARAVADRRRLPGRRRRQCRRRRRAAGDRRAASPAVVPRASRGIADRRGPDPARPFAKQLIHETQMQHGRRRDGVRLRQPPPLQRDVPPPVRTAAVGASSRSGHDPAGDATSIRLVLAYSPPYDWPAIIEFLSARAIPGVEVVEPDTLPADDRARRTPGQHRGEPGGRPGCSCRDDSVPERSLPSDDRRPHPARFRSLGGRLADRTAARRRRRPGAACAARPGLRVPGAWDGFELAVRAILGQQITVSGARVLGGQDRGRPWRAARRRTARFDGGLPRSRAPGRCRSHRPRDAWCTRPGAVRASGLGGSRSAAVRSRPGSRHRDRPAESPARDR